MYGAVILGFPSLVEVDEVGEVLRQVFSPMYPFRWEQCYELPLLVVDLIRGFVVYLFLVSGCADVYVPPSICEPAANVGVVILVLRWEDA